MSIVGKQEKLGIFRMSPKQFARACELGVYGHKKVELLLGIPFAMTTNPPHDATVDQLAEALRPIVKPHGLKVLEEKTAKLAKSLPRPDVMAVRMVAGNYSRRHPGPADIALVVEVSDTTYARDQGLKYRQYAASGLPLYWIVRLDQRRIEVYSDPVGRGRDACYRSCQIYLEGDRVPILDSTLSVGEILPAPAQ
jgi:Uma2 family endonuclease